MEPYNKGRKDFSTLIDVEQKLVADNLEQVKRLTRIEETIKEWQKVAGNPEIEKRKEVNRGQATMQQVAVLLAKKTGKDLIDTLRIQFETFIDVEKNLMKERQGEVATALNFNRIIIVVFTLVASALGLFAGFIITRSITKPLNNVLKIAENIAKGERNILIEITSKEETGQLMEAMQRMLASIIKSEAELNETNLALEEQNWLKTGLSEMNDQMRGDLDLPTLCRNVIEFISEYLNIQIGALYLNQKNDMLTLAGTYAYTRRKNLSEQFKFGDGLVGQAALERKSIIISNVPDDYIKITSGLGEKSPKNIMVAPILYEDEVKGVIEIGSFEEFSDRQIELVKQTVENISIGINSAQSRIQMQHLLKESQTLTEELQSQQEELQESNEQLEEQTQALEQSKTEMENRNQELERAQEEINARAEQLVEASRYKSEFLANMSHELRTPLNSIMILSKLLYTGKSGKINSEQEKQTRNIYEAGGDLLRLINDVLDLAKIESGKIPLNVGEFVLKDLLIQLEVQFETIAKEKGLELSFNLKENLPVMVSSDKDRIEQIMNNFLSNAIKFTDSGSVELSVHNLSMADIENLLFPIAFKANLTKFPEKYVGISVTDTGMGIPNDKHHSIFEAFQQLDGSISRKYGGTGLGLSICRELAEMLGGGILLKSSPGSGSTFTLIVPKHTETNLLAEYDRLHDNKVSHRRQETLQKFMIRDDQDSISLKSDKVILIVEDDYKFADTLKTLAHERMYKVLLANTGMEAIRLANEYIPRAIILDIQLPIMDGWQVLRTLKQNSATRHIPVHIISVVKEENLGYKLGALEYLVKPVKLEDIEMTFMKLESHIERKIRRLLIVEDNDIERESIVKLIGDADIEITAVATGKEALENLRLGEFDCFVLDLKLPDMDGYAILQAIHDDDTIKRIPTIVYTGKDISIKDEKQIMKFAESIILKTAASPARLLEETTIFLHRVEKNMNQEKRNLLSEPERLVKLFENKTILLVDDDVRNTYSLSTVLENQGLNVISAFNGQEALDRLSEHKEINVVLMDIMMPIMDGYEAIKRIRKQEKYEKLPIIAITARAMKEDQDKCIAAGASDYMNKPIDYDRLLSLIRVWLSAKE